MSDERTTINVTTPTKFGTFGGVFTPCVLTILGVIMFLRFGQVVGQSGWVVAVGIVLAAKAITTLTALSLSAIATNTRVRGGGAYYLISRSLGVEFGGAIGVLFFVAGAVSVAMYVIGFTEALVGTVPGLPIGFTAIATLVNLGVFVCVYIGAGWTIRVQYFILAILVASIASFFAGAIPQFDPTVLAANARPSFTGGENTLTMFALFFPAVTGIMAGANMSGDLDNPSRSLPTGTLAAVAATAAVYLVMAFALAGTRPAAVLIDDTLVMREIAVTGSLITAGVFAATLSSALGSMMGAPRILQAFARDEVFTRLNFFAAGSGPSDEPRRATVLTFVIAQIGITLGDLNAIAPIITMFFMITYGLLNLATFIETVTGNPSYRPTFRYSHWSTALLGVIGCAAVMFLINWFWAVVSIAVIAGLYAYIRSKEVESRWGDLRSGLIFERARRSLLRLEAEVHHPKNWRPIVMALSGTGWTRPHIPIYGHWMTSGHGILTLAQVVTGDLEDMVERRDQLEANLSALIVRENLQAFPVVACDEQLAAGIESLIQCHGIGGIRPNTVLMGWPNDPIKAAAFGGNIRLIAKTGRSVLAARFLRHRDEPSSTLTNPSPHFDDWNVPPGTIDVWWRGMKNGELMLLLAHLIHRNPEWRKNPVRVLRVIAKEEGRGEVLNHFADLSAESRIPFETEVVVSDRPAPEVIQEASCGASIVFLGFQTPDAGDEEAMWNRMETVAGRLPRVILVDSAGGMKLES